MAKAKKQRADKYDEKLKIEGDFEDVIGVSVSDQGKTIGYRGRWKKLHDDIIGKWLNESREFFFEGIKEPNEVGHVKTGSPNAELKNEGTYTITSSSLGDYIILYFPTVDGEHSSGYKIQTLDPEFKIMVLISQANGQYFQFSKP